MDAKQKAKELVHWFDTSTVLSFDKCKVCAILCVNEIIAANPIEEKYDHPDFFYLGVWEQKERAIRYWNIVKYYINKL